MAAIAAALIPECDGLVVTRAGHAGPPHQLPSYFELIEAGHPIPDRSSLAAAERAMALAKGLDAGDQLVMLVSGGGSALLSLPAAGITIADKQSLTRQLLRSGATIAEINCVRKHLSQIKGGRLAAAAAPARVITLVLSDVPGDDPSLVASGPTIADSTTLAQAREILARYAIECPPQVVMALFSPENETPSADVLEAAAGDIRVLARARDALAAARRLAEQRGYSVVDLGDHLEGEARMLGAEHASLARSLSMNTGRTILLSGGETTVTVANAAGRGGRNLEYLLGMALALDGDPRVWALACDTDGIDGTEDSAGAIIAPDTLARARAFGLDPWTLLQENNAYSFFQALGDLVISGPTRTNVNDFRAVLIGGGQPLSP